MFRLCLIGLTSFLCVLNAKANDSDFDIKPLQEQMLKTIELVRPAVVAIRGQGAMFSGVIVSKEGHILSACLLYTSPSPRDRTRSRMPSSA